MVKDHSDSEKGNPLPPHRLLLSINSKGFFYMHHSTDRITHTTAFDIHQSWSTGWNENKCFNYTTYWERPSRPQFPSVWFPRSRPQGWQLRLFHSTGRSSHCWPGAAPLPYETFLEGEKKTHIRNNFRLNNFLKGDNSDYFIVRVAVPIVDQVLHHCHMRLSWKGRKRHISETISVWIISSRVTTPIIS